MEQIKNGNITIDMAMKDSKTGEVSFVATSLASDSKLEETNTASIDKTALARAEAKYEHDTKELDQKDKKFDMDLDKLETERNALDTERESVKKCISNNIEHSFGIFS